MLEGRKTPHHLFGIYLLACVRRIAIPGGARANQTRSTNGKLNADILCLTNGHVIVTFGAAVPFVSANMRGDLY